MREAYTCTHTLLEIVRLPYNASRAFYYLQSLQLHNSRHPSKSFLGSRSALLPPGTITRQGNPREIWNSLSHSLSFSCSYGCRSTNLEYPRFSLYSFPLDLLNVVQTKRILLTNDRSFNRIDTSFGVEL